MSDEPQHPSREPVDFVSKPIPPPPDMKPPAPPTPLVSVAEAVKGLPALWQKPDRVVTTGLIQLDAALAGGLRGGNMIAFAGAAKSGKSALAGQIAYDAAAAPASEGAGSGAIVVYASAEMTREEVMSRWIARELFRQAEPSGRDWAVSYGDVLYGKAYRGECAKTPEASHQISDRLTAAMQTVHEVGARIFVERLPPGATPAHLRAYIDRARAQGPALGEGEEPPLVVLVVDPLQRLYASEIGNRKGNALDNLNANETARVGAVAEELKSLADELGVCVIFTSDTTKAAVSSAASSATSLRGSYALNHWATSIFGLQTAPGLDLLAERLQEAQHFDASGRQEWERWARQWVPANMLQRPDAIRMGSRVAWVECSGNRAGPAQDLALGFVGGAMHFAEEPSKPDRSERQPARASTSGLDSGRKKRRGKSAS